MKILYGVAGEGMGHGTRSKVVLRHLVKRGHTVLVATSDQALRVLRPPSDVAPPYRLVPIVGMGFRCKGGAIDLKGTIEENMRRLPRMLTENVTAWQTAQAFQPDVVITDFDSFAAFFADAHRLPLVSVDNLQVMPRCVHRSEALAPHFGGMNAHARFSAIKAPSAAHFVVTSFFFPPVKPHLRQTTTLVPPILRDEVLRLAANPPPPSDHVLVYKTRVVADEPVLAPLAQVPAQRFVVYGLKEGATLPPNVEAKPFDEVGFLKDFASARAVVGNAGMSMLGEALAFGKPMFAMPVQGQYEQVLNGAYLQLLGYGMTSETFSPDQLRTFLERRDIFAKAIARVPQHDANERLYSVLDALFPPQRRA